MDDAGTVSIGQTFGMIPLTVGTGEGGVASVAAIGAHCAEIVIGAGATLMQIAHDNSGVVGHALVFSGAGTEREMKEKWIPPRRLHGRGSE